MKRKLISLGAVALLFFLLKFPAEAADAAGNGMKLWLNTLIPTLLPFLILTGILLHTDGIHKILNPLSFLWKKVLGLSPYGAYVFFLGLLCGYPMGAKLTHDLYSHNKLGKQEAEYLLTFCNNASPAFLTTYLAGHCLGEKVPVWTIIRILLLSDMICMLFFRFVIYRNRTVSSLSILPEKKETSNASSPGTVIDVSIMNGFETVTRLGGYILLFSVLSALISHYWSFPAGKYLVLGALEITTGLHQLSCAGLPLFWHYLLSMTMVSFGGLCILAQTKSVLEDELSILPYASAKCMNAVFTAALVCLSQFSSFQ